MRRPIHLWIVGILSLLWNAGGAMDYVMTRTGNADYLAQIPAEQLAVITEMPLWSAIAWPIGVWFSVIGSLLLLLRSRFAGTAFFLSLAGLLVSTIYTYGLASPNAWEFGTSFSHGFTIAIYLVLILLWIYARRMTRRGVLG